MSGRWTGAPSVAQHQAQSTQPVTYGTSVLGQASDPLEWFPFDSLSLPD
jgi:hypothetical protein